MSAAPPLDTAQRRFFAALQEPLAGEARTRTELAPGAADVSAGFHATAQALLQSTPMVGASERLGLYHRQYWYRILDSLAEDFPHLLRLLGHDDFWALLERYLAAHPPASFTLRHLGAGLTEFVASDRLLAPAIRPWASDLARFEYAFMEVFEASVLPVPIETDFATHPIRFQPTVRLVPVNRSLTTWLQTPSLAFADLKPQRQLLIVWRDTHHRLHHVRETLGLHPLIESLQNGGLLTEILARASTLPSPPRLKAAFERWQQRGWFALAE